MNDAASPPRFSLSRKTTIWVNYRPDDTATVYRNITGSDGKVEQVVLKRQPNLDEVKHAVLQQGEWFYTTSISTYYSRNYKETKSR